MRLLNSCTLQFCEFYGSKIPFYAILSHTWGEEEVLFQDMQDGSGKEKGKAGYEKIKGCCALAASEGWEYVWIDTCCIDKTSSAELSEAINSMFEWYRGAQVCYAYLADVTSSRSKSYETQADFARSRWFTRGWTLQELLAPPTVIFFNRDWVELGTRSSMSDLVSTITHIASSDIADFKDANVAVKMSWAASRETTRIEDIAYCLLGLFGVNMPLLYGEGRNAFVRLQLEILRTSDDETVFAWEGKPDTKTGLLALSPAEFSSSGDIRRIVFDEERPECSMTNRGLRNELLLWKEVALQIPINGGEISIQCGCEIYLAPLNCTRDPEGHPVAIYLMKDGEDESGVTNGFIRCSSSSRARITTFRRTPKLDDSVFIHSHSGGVLRYPLQMSGTMKDFALPGYAPFHLGEGQSVRLVNGSAYLVESVPRSVVYVKQLQDRSVTNKPCQFSIRYPPSYCSISEIRLRTGLAGWMEGEPGECELWLDRANDAALLLFDADCESHRGMFALLLTKHSDNSASADLAVAHRAQPVPFFLALLKRQLERNLRTDRISRNLQYKFCVSAAVRPRPVSGEKQFLIEIQISPNSRSRWHHAPKRMAAQQVDEEQYEILDQINGYTPLRGMAELPPMLTDAKAGQSPLTQSAKTASSQTQESSPGVAIMQNPLRAYKRWLPNRKSARCMDPYEES